MSATRSICDNKAVVYLLSVLAIVLWGMSYIWSDRLIALGVPISYFVPLRIFVAGIILLLFNILTKNFRLIARKDIWKFLLLALFEPLIYFFCETYGIKETGSPTISAMIIASSTDLLSRSRCPVLQRAYLDPERLRNRRDPGRHLSGPSQARRR